MTQNLASRRSPKARKVPSTIETGSAPQLETCRERRSVRPERQAPSVGIELGSCNPLDQLRGVRAADRQLDLWRRQTITRARQQWASWSQIGDALGGTQQAAWALYNEGVRNALDAVRQRSGFTDEQTQRLADEEREALRARRGPSWTRTCPSRQWWRRGLGRPAGLRRCRPPLSGSRRRHRPHTRHDARSSPAVTSQEFGSPPSWVPNGLSEPDAERPVSNGTVRSLAPGSGCVDLPPPTHRRGDDGAIGWVTAAFVGHPCVAAGGGVRPSGSARTREPDGE